MQNSDLPAKLPLPFASSGTRASIPTPSQIGITPGKASLTDGFPPLTFTPLASGGVPASGADMNGILYILSQEMRWAQAGGSFAYDSAFSTAIGGYPAGAVILTVDGTGYWRSTANNNTSDPEGGSPTGWVPHYHYGVATQAMSSSNVTLTALQYAKPILILTGTITTNVNVVFPNFAGHWTVVNATTGAFKITAKTAAGTGVALLNGANDLYCDASDVGFASDQGIPSTFVPDLKFGGTTGTAFASRGGNAIITRRKVEFWARATLSAVGVATGTARFVLTGLPPVAIDNVNVFVSVDLMNALPGQINGLLINNTNEIEIRYMNLGTGSQASGLTNAHFTNNTVLYFNGSYLY